MALGIPISIDHSVMSLDRSTYDLCIIGGGVAGLSLAILSAREGHSVLLIEKDTYPRQKVCGEYISRESEPFLRSLGLDIEKHDLPIIDRFRITSQHGQVGECDLGTGGIGVSRYFLDHF